MNIPWQDINPETLTTLLEHFVLREGTDYGEHEVPLAEKVKQVRASLASGDAIIVYSDEDDSIDIHIKA